ncbi:MAG: hypothetical protein ACFHX7_06585 [Pseudomonadota bacterium]
MNQLPALLRREFQENSGAFLVLPLVISTFMIVILLLVLLMVSSGGGEGVVVADASPSESPDVTEILLSGYYGEYLETLAAYPLPDRERVLDRAYKGVGAPLLVVLWFVVLFYLLGTLYDDRRDRSILFWKSMPVSDAMTVFSKLVTALVLVPGIYFALVALIQVVLLVITCLSALGGTFDVWEALVVPANLGSRWLELVGFHLLTIIWCLPFYAWILLVSARADSVPLAWAIGIPVGLAIVDAILIPGDWVGGFMARHIAPVGYTDDYVNGLQATALGFVSLELVVSTLVAAAFFYLAILARGRADEI